jgi:hypothetical protein
LGLFRIFTKTRGDIRDFVLIALFRIFIDFMAPDNNLSPVTTTPATINHR